MTDLHQYVEEADGLVKKWQPVLESEDAPKIKSAYMAGEIAKMLEMQKAQNQITAAQMGQQLAAEDGSNSNTGNIATWDPVLISMVRRAAPVLLPFAFAGVQTLQMPTGLIFALRSRLTDKNGAEILFNAPDTSFTGRKPTGTEQGLAGGENAGTITAGLANEDPFTGLFLRGVGMNTPDAEGDVGPEVTFTIERINVEAKERQLKGGYSIELEQDLQRVHNLSAQNELTKVMSDELLFEQNREFARLMYSVAKLGAANTASAGTYDVDVDADGRWSVEKFKGLIFQILIEANRIGIETRRGLGNTLIVSPNVAAALYTAGAIDTGGPTSFGAAMGDADLTRSTYVGKLLGRFDVHIDPFTTAVDFVMIAYVGSSNWDRGVYYCPYTPMEMYKATDPKSFQPRFAYKTRYGLVSNPFVSKGDGSNDAMAMTPRRNQYFRIFKVDGLYGA